jgi:hypothetical protein
MSTVRTVTLRLSAAVAGPALVFALAGCATEPDARDAGRVNELDPVLVACEQGKGAEVWLTSDGKGLGMRVGEDGLAKLRAAQQACLAELTPTATP